MITNQIKLFFFLFRSWHVSVYLFFLELSPRDGPREVTHRPTVTVTTAAS